MRAKVQIFSMSISLTLRLNDYSVLARKFKIDSFSQRSQVSVCLCFQKSKIQKPITFLGGRLKLFSCRQQLKFFDLATLNAVFALPPSASHRSIIFLVRHLFLIHVFRSTPPTIIVVSPSLIICEQVFSSLLKLRRAELQFSGFSPLDNTDWSRGPTCVYCSEIGCQ